MLFVRSFLGAIITDVILAMLLFWLLPQQDIQISPVLKIVLLSILPVWAILTFIPRKRALLKEVISPAQAMVGKKGTAITRLNPEGTVRIHFEIWNAKCDDTIEEGEAVAVLCIDGLILTVQKENSDC
jgi:membrane-bound serine protease (ClpP class)